MFEVIVKWSRYGNVTKKLFSTRPRAFDYVGRCLSRDIYCEWQVNYIEKV